MIGQNHRFRTFLTPSTFVLLAAVCIVGTLAADVGRQNYVSSEAEEAKEVSEPDDVDLPCAIVDTRVHLIFGASFDECLAIEHDSAIRNSSWDCWSRGPPTR